MKLSFAPCVLLLTVLISMSLIEMSMAKTEESSQLRARSLPGEDYFQMDDITSAEAGFIAGVLVIILFLILLVCCCCGRCSLWDIVALVCLWELCCDRDVDPSGFAAF